MYYIGKGVDLWDNYEHVSGEPGAERDDGVRQASIFRNYSKWPNFSASQTGQEWYRLPGSQ